MTTTDRAGFAIVGTALVIMLVSMCIVSDAVCTGYVLRNRTARFNPVSHIVVPLLGTAAFVPAWSSAVGWSPFGWSFISPLEEPVPTAEAVST